MFSRKSQGLLLCASCTLIYLIVYNYILTVLILFFMQNIRFLSCKTLIDIIYLLPNNTYTSYSHIGRSCNQ